ncbi:acetyltransferase [Xylariales sp. AK1849]|nr:acetyltransferase [Xylariales sp. AK1849]
MAAASQVHATAIVTTENCFIRPYEPDDAVAIAAVANHQDVARFMRNRFPHPYTLNDAKSWINLASERKPLVDFAICLLDGTFVGSIGLMPGTDTESYSWEIGYWLGKDHWGKGIATNAVKGFCKWAFGAFSILRLQAGVYEGNDASMKVLERSGFLKEGVRRKAVFKWGIALDIAMFGLLREDVEAST